MTDLSDPPAPPAFPFLIRGEALASAGDRLLGAGPGGHGPAPPGESWGYADAPPSAGPAPPWLAPALPVPGGTRHRQALVALATAAAVAVVVVVGGGVALTNRWATTPVALGTARHNPAPGAPSPGPPSGNPAAPVSTPAPPVRSPASADAAYKRLVTADASPMTTAVENLDATCSAGNAAGCRAAALTIQRESDQFLADLDRTPPPSDLIDADGLLHRGLGEYAAGAGQVIAGIDSRSGDEVTAGDVQMTHGDGLVSQAVTALGAAPQTPSAPI